MVQHSTGDGVGKGKGAKILFGIVVGGLGVRLEVGGGQASIARLRALVVAGQVGPRPGGLGVRDLRGRLGVTGAQVRRTAIRHRGFAIPERHGGM